MGEAGRPLDACLSTLEAFLLEAPRPEKDRVGGSNDAFFAFKLHQFLAGAGRAYTTLDPGLSPRRHGRTSLRSRRSDEATLCPPLLPAVRTGVSSGFSVRTQSPCWLGDLSIADMPAVRCAFTQFCKVPYFSRESQSINC
jgi:hypothetical protein